MKVVTLCPEDALFGVFNTKFIFTFADLTTAGLTQSITCLPASGTVGNRIAVIRTGYDLITPFTGGAVATMGLDFGDVGSASRYIAKASTDLFTALATSAANCWIASTAPYAYCGGDIAANGILKALFTSTVGNVNACTAGEVHIYAMILDISKGQFEK